MKNSIFLFLLLISSATFAQNCNIGNQSSTGFANPADPIFKDYLTGIKFTLGNVGTIRLLNLIGRNSGANVKMALYKDVAGVPGDLITETSTGTVTSGVVSLSVTPTVLNPGSYWVMAIYSTNGNHTYSKTQSSSVVGNDSIYYKAQTFASAIPTNASDFILYRDKTIFTYFLGIDCGITIVGITKATHPSIINFYPNPTTDLVTIKTLPNLTGESYRITSITGTQITEGKLTDEVTVIDVNALQAGIYFMILGDRERETIKFVKQ